MSDFEPSPALLQEITNSYISGLGYYGGETQAAMETALYSLAQWLTDPANAADWLNFPKPPMTQAEADARMELHGFTDDDIGGNGPHRQEPDCLEWAPFCQPLYRVRGAQ
jgi:hypothetical protein